MRRLTSVFAHVLPTVAALGLLVTAPALAQTTPPPSRAIVTPVPATPTPDDVLTPSIQRGAASTRPVSTPSQGRQPGQGQQGQPGQQGQQPTPQGVATTPPASAPRAEAPRAPNLSGPNNMPMN